MDEEVEKYIRKQKMPQKEICKKLRQIILKTLPGTKEEMKWGVPVYAGGKFYIGVLRKQVNMGFAITGLSKEEVKLFEGSGKTMKHIKVPTVESIDEKKLAKLLKLVDKKASCEGC